MIGRTLGHYRILEEIGKGGMGVVYRAHDERLERDVALKVLPAGTLADEAARKRFRKEALALSKLNHPNIETVHDFDTQAGVDFLVMEYIPGVTLSDKLAPRREGQAGPALAEKEVVRLGLQLAEGLAAAHEQGVIHRDLKPGNLRVTPDGRLKILDFGLAKLVRPLGETATTESLTETQAVAGTLPYMAPEQLRGQAPDPRSDVWALGVVLHEALTGQRPFQGATSAELSSAILKERPAPLPAQTPRGLRAVIERCLEKEPGQRYQRAGEARAALEAAYSGVAVFPWVGWRYLLTRRQWLALAGALATMVAVVAVLLALNVVGLRDWFFGQPPINSLAVLPLENLSGDAEQEYFADGMTEALITDLAKIGGLGVIARTSVMQYKGKNKPLAEIARELKVDVLVTGSVVRAGDRVRITVQLVNPASEQQLWAERYERDLRNILVLQSDVARAIANEIRVQLTPVEQASLAARPQVAPAAYEANLRGRYHLRRATGEELKKAQKYFEQAVKIDPGYAPAYTGLADYYLTAYELSPEVAMNKAKDYAQKALALDPTLGEAHFTLGIIKYAEWDWSGAEQQFRRALELNPSSAEAHRIHAMYLATVGRGKEAWAEIRTAQELDPLSVDINTTAGWVAYFGRQFDQAIEQCKKALDLDRNAANAHDCLGSAYLAKEMYEQAINECRMATTLSGRDPDRAVCLGRAYAAAGKRAEARRVLEELKAAAPRIHVPPYFVGLLHAALGENDEAFAWLEKSYRERDPYLALINVNPAADSLRADPRFEQLMRRLGLSP